MAVKFIGVIILTWFFVEGSEPIKFIKNFCGIGNDSKPKSTIKILIQKLSNCALCMGFWFGMIFYQDIWMACVVSVCAEIFHRLITILFDRI